LVDAQIGRGDGHGTKMATIAGGKIHGVAPNANLYLLKVKGQWNKGSGSDADEKSGSVQPKALMTTFGVIRDHVRDRLIADAETKSVINMSWGKLSQRLHSLDLN
jgi:subtilisin family serine protease